MYMYICIYVYVFVHVYVYAKYILSMYITSSKDIVDLFAELGKVSRKDRGSDQKVLPFNFKLVCVNSGNWP